MKTHTTHPEMTTDEIVSTFLDMVARADREREFQATLDRLCPPECIEEAIARMPRKAQERLRRQFGPEIVPMFPRKNDQPELP